MVIIAQMLERATSEDPQSLLERSGPRNTQLLVFGRKEDLVTCFMQSLLFEPLVRPGLPSWRALLWAPGSQLVYPSFGPFARPGCVHRGSN